MTLRSLLRPFLPSFPRTALLATALFVASGPATVFAALPSPAARIGLTFAFGTPEQGTTAVAITRIQDLGLKLVRQTTYCDLTWSQIELVDNTFTFANADLAINATVGFTVQPTLYSISASSTELYGLQVPFNVTAGIKDGWKTARDSAVSQNYVQTTVARYKSVVRHWEISNEMEGKTTRPLGLPTAEFAAFLVLNRGWIRAIDPEALVVLPGLSGTYGLPLAGGLQWLRDLLAAGGAAGFDIFTYHDYNSWWTLPKHFDDVRAILDANGLSAVPIWCSETSISSGKQTSITPPYSSIDEQAADVWRRFCLLFGKGAQNVNWHGHYSNAATPTSDGFSDFGLLTSAGSLRKKSWHAMKLLIQKIEGFTSARLVATGTITDDNTSGGAGAWVVEFTFAGGTKKYVAWSPDTQSYTLTGLTGMTSATLTTVVPASVTSDGLTPTWTTSTRSLVGTSLALTLASAPILVEPSATTAVAITTQPATQTVTAGASVTFTVAASGSPAPTTYQWFKNGTAIAGATGASYTLATTASTDAGSYTCAIGNGLTSATSAAAVLTVNAASRLSNLSVRTTLATGGTLIVGLTMEGGARNVLVRAGGPVLTGFGLSGVMADPKLSLYSGTAKILENDNWIFADIATTASSVGAFAYTAGSKDAAFIQTLNGGYTVQASGTAAGTVLVEAYDIGSATTPRLTNVSARNFVGTGADLLIAGFTVSGTGTKRILIRAVGPTLASFGVTGTLADPKLELYSGTTLLQSNDNWDSALATTFGSVGAFALTTGSKDAAFIATVNAGAGYTVQVSGTGGLTGEALVELYELP